MPEYTVAVALSNPANVPKLIHIAALIATEHHGGLVVTSVVPAPDEDAPASGHDPDAFDKAQSLVQRGYEAALARGIQCERRVAVGQHIHEGIVNVAEGHQANLLVMGMSESLHPSLETSDIEFDRVVDAVSAHAPCNVLIAKFRDGMHFDSALVWVSDHIDFRMVEQVIVPLHRQARVEIEFVSFAASQQQARQVRTQVNQRLEEAGLTGYGRLTVQVGEEAADALIEASNTHDLILLGTPPLHQLERRLLGSVAEQVVHNAYCTTLVMRPAEKG